MEEMVGVDWNLSQRQRLSCGGRRGNAACSGRDKQGDPEPAPGNTVMQDLLCRWIGGELM